MRILAAYDGSSESGAIFSDFARAGLPETVQVRVFSVAECWLLPQTAEQPSLPEIDTAEASAIAAEAAARIQDAFPGWAVSATADAGSPAGLILRYAQEWDAEMIIVGARGHTMWERMLIGSVSGKVASAARCSVRVARNAAATREGGLRLVVAYDGLEGSNCAVRVVAGRTWPAGTRVRLVTCVGFGFKPVSGAGLSEDYEYVRQIQLAAEVILSNAALEVEHIIREDDPKRAICEEAERFSADCVFLGSNDNSLVVRALLGTVALAVTTRAPCSVEIVRPPHSVP